MAQISKYVRDALKAQLSAVATGFNDRHALIAPTYGVDPVVIDWSPESQNFIFGRVNPAQFEETSVFQFPLLTIDTVRSQNTNRVKYATFSGQVAAVIDVHHSWPDASVIGDFASWLDATEDAVIACLNDRDNQHWPGNLLWNGQVGITRGTVQEAGEGWLQSLSFVCTFDLTV